MGCGGSSSGGGTKTNSLRGLASCQAVSDEAVVCGTIYAADGITPVSGAIITLTSASSSSSSEKALKGLYYSTDEHGLLKLVENPSACITDTSGAFACAGIYSSGAYFFQATQSGVGTVVFSTLATVDQTKTIEDTDELVSESTVKWLAVPGSFDGVQLLLSQLKGCTLSGDESKPEDLIASLDCIEANLVVEAGVSIATVFASVDNLTVYHSIFINSDADMSDYATVLQEYVAQGGNLYFSNLSADGLTAAFPNNITFGSASTSAGVLEGASIDYAALATYLDSSTLDVTLSSGGWQDITSVESNVTTYISGDASSIGGSTNTPITVGWKEGSGGCVFYTSYHIAGASTGSAQERALKYLILNIGEVCE